MNEPDYEGAVAYARSRLEQDLPPHLSYHNASHTFDSVVPAALRLAEICGVSTAETRLLNVAAAFHDIGWLQRRKEHEAAGVAIVREVLPRFGFSAEQIERIAGIIMATRLPQSPTNLLEAIMADADLDVLGREDFWPLNVALRTELEMLGNPMTDVEWYRSQLEFLQEHEYWTPAARQLRDESKQAYIAEVEERLMEAVRAWNTDRTDSTDAH